MWAPARWMVGLGALLLATAFVVDETTRLVECAAGCGERHYRNARLLESSMCTEWSQRRHMEDLCGRAERENAVPFVGCTARAYWASSGVYAALGNHLVVVALVAPALLFVIHQWFADRRAQRQEEARPQMIFGHSSLLAPQGHSSLRMYPEGHASLLAPQGHSSLRMYPEARWAEEDSLVQPDL
jgi:hypothetical protein